ncbi:heavy-metal-associated domain-containing protein, partial [Micromonospora sp. NPDC003776]
MTSLGRYAGLLLSPAALPDVVARVARTVATAVPDAARGAASAASEAAPHSLGEAAESAGVAATRLARLAGLTRRRVWTRDGRHHIEVHGVCQNGGDRLARQVEDALEGLPGVAWARVNAPSGRVIVAVEEPRPKLRDLIATVARTERVCPHEPDPEIPPPHPPEEGPRTPRTLGALVSDALGLTISAATRILPFAPVPAEVAGFLTAIDLHPKLHALADRGLRA